ncbi:efflux RND transporter periplasmic adaptor subunit [Hoeflea marina]|nr:HlyD family efflux transporter periplasmic adaptor subunit [Hoeflea marina]
MKFIAAVLLLAAIGYGFYAAFRTAPVLVDLVAAARGPMQVTIDEEGTARVRHVYSVSSPIAGHLDRVTLEEGDPVTPRTVIARIHPLESPFLDTRTRAQLEASIAAARSAVASAQFELQRAENARDLARSNYRRMEQLARDSVVSDSQLERGMSEWQGQEALVDSARAGVGIRQAELASAEAQLTQPPSDGAPASGTDCCVNIRSPISGVVLAVHARSEQAVSVGTLIADVGDPSELEITVDVLSSDAVNIRPGARVEISDWGGAGDLEATVRRINPAAFTRVSALGIEEQRVNVLLDPAAVPPGLGHGYRVFARLVVWSSDDALQIPVGALFRDGGAWAVFRVRDGVARTARIDIGQMGAASAQVIAGLEQGDEVVLYPNDTLRDGSPVRDRKLAE